jgi:hypothetical protein
LPAVRPFRPSGRAVRRTCPSYNLNGTLITTGYDRQRFLTTFLASAMSPGVALT